MHNIMAFFLPLRLLHTLIGPCDVNFVHCSLILHETIMIGGLSKALEHVSQALLLAQDPTNLRKELQVFMSSCIHTLIPLY